MHGDVVRGVLIALDGCVLSSALAGVGVLEVVKVDASEGDLGSPRAV